MRQGIEPAGGVIVATENSPALVGGEGGWADEPDRKRLIIEAALDVIADRGVDKTTHRAIAERAQIPLGSMTYHFDGLDDVISRAFRRFASVLATRYRGAVADAESKEAACEAVVDLICSDVYASEREMGTLLELYAYANHSAGAEKVRREWMAVSWGSLAVHFDTDAQQGLDALIEGWAIRRLFLHRVPDRAIVLRAVRAIAGG